MMKQYLCSLSAWIGKDGESFQGDIRLEGEIKMGEKLLGNSVTWSLKDDGGDDEDEGDDGDDDDDDDDDDDEDDYDNNDIQLSIHPSMSVLRLWFPPCHLGL